MPQNNNTSLGTEDPNIDTQSAYPSGTTQNDLRKQVESEGNVFSGKNMRPGERNLELEQQNRQRAINSGEVDPNAPEQLIQEWVNNATYGTPNPIFGAITSSTGAKDQMDQMYGKAKGQLTNQMRQLPTPQYERYQDFTGEIDAARDQGRTLFDDIKKTIEEDYRIRQSEEEDANRVRMGANTKALARMKSLGTSAGSIGFLQEIDRDNQRQLDKLVNEKNKLLIEATQAYQQQDYKMLVDKMGESKKLTDQINQIEQWKFADAIATNDQIMKQNRFGWEAQDRAMNDMDTWASTYDSYEEIPQYDRKRIEEMAGVPEGFFAKYFDIAKQSAAQESIMADVKYQQSIVDLLSDLPEDQAVMIDGELVYGWSKEKRDVWHTTMTDEFGNVTFVEYDNNTGELITHGLGNIGSSRNGNTLKKINGSYYSINQQTGAAEPVMTKDRNIDPSYLDGFGNWIESIGTVTTPFGGQTGFETVHPGWDIANEVGTPIKAFKGGRVVNVNKNPNGGYGKYVEVEDAEGRIWRYSHLDQVNVAAGQRITEGSVFGTMGNTGNVLTTRHGGEARIPTPEERAKGWGSHLDLRVFIPGKQPQEAEDSNPSDDSVLTRDQFETAYIETIAEAGSMSIDPTIPTVQAEIDKAYEDYKSAINSSSNQDNERFVDALTSTDKRKMLARGLNPEDPVQAKEYIEQEYGEESNGDEKSNETTLPWEQED